MEALETKTQEPHCPPGWYGQKKDWTVWSALRLSPAGHSEGKSVKVLDNILQTSK